MSEGSSVSFSIPASPDPAESSSLTTPTIYNKEAIQSLPRHFIITQLREAGFGDIADALQPVSNPNDPLHEAFEAIAAALSEEREEQFNDMLNTLAVDENTLKLCYDTIAAEMFKGKTHWGRIVTFVVFTSHVVLYCARREKLKHTVPLVVEWADTVIHGRLHRWIEEQGGWQAFVEHFDVESWRISLSAAVFGIGLGAGLLAGGIFALKKLLYSS